MAPRDKIEYTFHGSSPDERSLVPNCAVSLHRARAEQHIENALCPLLPQPVWKQMAGDVVIIGLELKSGFSVFSAWNGWC